MTDHERKIELMRKYALDISTNFSFHIKGEIPSKIIDNAIRKFAFGLDRTTIIGFYDTTITNSGKSGYIFTDSSVYYLETLEKPKVIDYEEISCADVTNAHKRKDCDRNLNLHMLDGRVITWDSVFLNKIPLCNFFNEMLEMIRAPHISDEIEEDYVAMPDKKGREISANNQGTLAEVIYRLYHCNTWADAIPDSDDLEPVAGFSYDNSLPLDIIDDLGIKSDVGMDLSTVLGVLGEGSLLSTSQSDGFVLTQSVLLIYQNKYMKSPIRIRYNEITDVQISGPEIIVKSRNGKTSTLEFCIHPAEWNKQILFIFLRFTMGEYGFYHNGALLRNISVQEIVEQIVEMEGQNNPEKGRDVAEERPRNFDSKSQDMGEFLERNKLVYDKSETFEVAVISTMSSGKSTFINALIGVELLPSRNQACTARITAVLDNDAAQSITGHVLFSDGKYEKIENCTAERVTELLDNQRDLLADLVVECSIPGIRNVGKALLVVDTPGVNNSVDKSHEEITRSYLKELSNGLILYIINGTQIATFDMQEDLLRIRDIIKEKPNTEILFVINKMDEFDIELEPIENTIPSVMAYLNNMGFSNISLYPISSLAALLFKKVLAGVELSRREAVDFMILFERFRNPNLSERLPAYIATPGIPVFGEICQVRGEKFRKGELLDALESTGLPAVEKAIEDRIIRHVISKAPKVQAPGAKDVGRPYP